MCMCMYVFLGVGKVLFFWGGCEGRKGEEGKGREGKGRKEGRGLGDFFCVDGWMDG